MRVYQTEQLLTNLQNSTEQFLNKVINEWQMMAPVHLLRQPDENKWSAAQCLEHLNSYGYYYLPAIEKAIDAAGAKSNTSTAEFKSGWLGNYFTKLMEPKEGKQMKMKAPKEHQPIPELDSDSVIREFIDQQERLLLLLEKARNIDIQKVRVPISIAKFIKLQLGDVFNFLIAHNRRHMVQAEKAIAFKKDQRAVA
jgi:hypothetical protein